MTAALDKNLIMPGGRTLLLSVVDGAGAPALVTGIANNAQQRITTASDGGSMTVTFGGVPSSSVPVRGDPAVLQAALELVSTIGSGNIKVSGFGDYTLEFIGSKAGLVEPNVSVTPSGLLGALPSPGSTISATTVTVNSTLGATFAITGPSWLAFSSQAAGWYGVLIPGTGLNQAHWTLSGIAAGTTSLSMTAVDPTVGNSLSAPNNVNSIVGTLVRAHVFDGTTYRGSPTFNPRQVNTHGPAPFWSGQCTSGTMHVYVADDADTGGALFVTPITAAPNYTQLDYYRPGTNIAPAAWQYGAAPRSVAVRFKCPVLGGSQVLFRNGSFGPTASDTLYLSAAGQLTFTDGSLRTVNGGSTLVAGTSYTVAFSTDGTTNVGRLYVNGVAETLSPNNDFTPQAVQNGSLAGAGIGMITQGAGSLVGLSSTIGRVAYWNRILTDPEQLAYHNSGAPPTFAGLAGVLASLATGVLSYYDLDPTNPGHDAGPSGVDFFAYYGPQPVENYGSPTVSVSSIRAGGPLPMRVNGVTTGVQLGATPLWGNSPSGNPYNQHDSVLFMCTGLINPGDVVSLDIPAGVIGTSAGPLPAATNLAVFNSSGIPVLPQFLKPARSMKVGYNITTQSYASGLRPYANLFIGSGPWLDLTGLLAVDAKECPNVDFSAQAPLAGIKRWLSYSNASGPDPAGEPTQRFGTYTLLWDGTNPGVTFSTTPRPGCTFAAGATTTCDSVTFTAGAGGVNNKVTAVFPPGREQSQQGSLPLMYDPYIGVVVPKSTAPFLTATNIRCYGPSVATPLAPPKFNPDVIALLSGCKVFRQMTWVVSNGAANCVNGDFLGDGEANGLHRNQWSTVARLDQYAYDPATVYSRPPGGGWNGYALLVTTTAPHGYHTGSTVSFYHNDQLTPYINYAPANGSGLNTYLNDGPSIYVLSPTTFVFTPPTSPFTGFVPTDMKVVCNPSAPSFVDACLLNNAIANVSGACTPWINIAHGATDACIVSQAQAAAATLNPVPEVLLELSNEPWNFGNFFPQNLYFVTMGVSAAVLTPTSTPPNPLTTMGFGPRALTGAEFYVLRAAQARKVFQDAWIAAGRSEPVRLVLNAQVGNTGMTQGYLDFCRDHDLNGNRGPGSWGAADAGFAGPIRLAGDGICVAPYYDIEPRNNLGDGTSPKPDVTLSDGIRFDQFMDVADGNFLAPKTQQWFYRPIAQRAAIAAHNHPDAASIHLDHYEGGPGYCGLDDSRYQQLYNSMSMPFHPRHYWEFAAYLKSMDDNGVRYFADFGFAFGYGPEGTGPGGPNTLWTNYTAWYGTKMQGITGTGSDGGPNTLASGILTNPGTGLAIPPKLFDIATGLQTVGSIRGAAIRDWNAGTVVPVVPTGAAPPGAGSATQRLWRRRLGQGRTR